ncbi:MAG: hypothetical protein AAGL08_14445 [Cyanobacteria bacterium J06573_11]
MKGLVNFLAATITKPENSMRCDHFTVTTHCHDALTPHAEIMISNSRPVTQPISFGSNTRPASKATASYSDNLMDDLFGDVDKILDGDLSDCMTVVTPQRRAVSRAQTATARTVQLPSNFNPRSAADIYQATMAAANQQASSHQAYYQATGQTMGQSPMGTVNRQQPPAPRPTGHRRSTGYSNGGRPVTAFHGNAAQSGNFRSAVIQSPIGTTTVEMRPAQSESNTYLYPQNTLQDLSPRPPQTIFEPRQQQQSVSLPFLLMGAAGISVASSLGLWAVGHSSPGNGWLTLGTEASAAEIPNSDEDFLAYLQDSLENISATQRASSQTVAAVIPVPTAGTLPSTVPNVNAAPTVGALPNLPGAANTTNVIERVFVPVYENNQTAAVTPTAPAAPLPSVALPNNAARPTVPVPAPVAAAAAIPAGAPAAPTSSVPIVTGAAALPTPNAPTTVAVAPTNSGLIDVTPSASITMVGVLNLGSRSAALFDIEGTSQRAYVGDRIGLSDWTLVSVNGQDVVIRRNGEVRSVYIGQQF